MPARQRTNIGTYDGSEIRRLPVEVGGLSLYFTEVLYVQTVVGFGYSEPSTVVFLLSSICMEML